MPIAPPALVVGVPRQPLPYGLTSVLTFRPAGASRWEGGVQFEVGTCDPADGIGEATIDIRNNQPIYPGLPKSLDSNGVGAGEASPFTVYGHFTCSPVGWTPSTAQDKADEHLLAREIARVEQALWTGDLGNVPSLQDAGTTTLGTGLSPVEGLAALEQWLGITYGSLGVIHMSRGLAELLLSGYALVTRGNGLYTQLGTPVIAGAGYPGTGPAGQAVAVGEAGWMYATPALFGYRSEVFTSSATPGDLLDRAMNDMYAVAERTYLLGFDPCGVAAVSVTVCGCSNSGTTTTTTTGVL